MFHALRVDVDYLKFRSGQLQICRQFMAQRGVMEVMTPLLRRFTGTDPHVDSFRVGDYYLQTSPELSMKILLAHSSGDIYQLSPVFRDEPVQGPYHQSEFLMLEWYRLNMNERELAQEVVELIQRLGVNYNAEYHDLRGLFLSFYKEDLWLISDDVLVMLTKTHVDVSCDLHRQDHIDLLIDHMIRILNIPLLVITGFPKSMQLMARFDQVQEIAKRFEVYVRGYEIANGFYELNDASAQRERMVKDNQLRTVLKKPVVELDEEFLLAVGRLPDCSGVALGLDRLTWLLLD